MSSPPRWLLRMLGIALGLASAATIITVPFAVYAVNPDAAIPVRLFWASSLTLLAVAWAGLLGFLAWLFWNDLR